MDYENDISRRKAKESGFDGVRQGESEVYPAEKGK
jgi:hypothetical protein